MKTQAIVPTAGSGTRFKSKILKQFVVLNGKPLFIHTLVALSKSTLIHSIIVVAPAQSIQRFVQLIQKYKIRKIKTVIAGGATRSQSVSNGLKALDLDTDIVLVHDGARPLVTVKVIDESIKLCHNSPAVVAAIAVKSTIKRVNTKSFIVEETLDRSKLWEVQTPQTFQRAVILKAHQKAKNDLATDDASLVEQIAIPVKVFVGDDTNIKVTTTQDLKVAKALLGAK